MNNNNIYDILPWQLFDVVRYIFCICIREYGSTLYVGIARKKKGRPCISIASGKLKSLLIYTDKLKYTYNL